MVSILTHDTLVCVLTDGGELKNRMGQVKVNVADLVLGKPVDAWYTVESSRVGDAVSGEVHLILDWQKSTGTSWISNLTSHYSGSSSSVSHSQLVGVPGTPTQAQSSGSAPVTPLAANSSTASPAASLTTHPIWAILKNDDLVGLQALLKEDESFASYNASSALNSSGNSISLSGGGSSNSLNLTSSTSSTQSAPSSTSQSANSSSQSMQGNQQSQSQSLTSLSSQSLNIHTSNSSSSSSGSQQQHSASNASQSNSSASSSSFNINIRNKYGDTPLHVAVQRTKWDDTALQMLLLLLAAPNLEVDCYNQDKNTPFHYFCQKFDHPSMLGPFNRFIERGADVNARNSFGETPMHKAIFNQSLKLGMVDLLWARGAQLEIQSQSGETPLHYAVRLGREDMVKFLIQKGADLNGQSSAGKTPLDVAQEEGIEAIATRIQDSKEIMAWLSENDLTRYMEEFLAHDVFVYLLPDLTDDLLSKFLGDSDASERAQILAAAHQTAGKGSTPEDAKRREKLLKQLAMKKQESILRKSLTETARARILSRANATHTQRNLNDLVSGNTSSSQNSSSSSNSSTSNSSSQPKAALRVTSTSTSLSVSPALVNKPSSINLMPGTAVEGANEWEIEPTDLEFIKSLGQGASGEVFQGTFKGEPVAIKVLKTNNTDAEVEEFKKEFSVLVSFNSPYIIRFKGACLADRLCMVMEFCPHGSLYDLLRSPDFVMTWDHFFTFAIETTAGLAVLHKAKPSILHRDMKTLNLLVDKDYHTKLCDFGLSRFNTGSNLATLSKCRGTYAYIAPEVYNCETFTTKSDVYSVAIILWELIYRVINGKYLRPFQEFKHIQFDFQVLIQACKMKLRPTLPPETPPPLEQLVKKCWHEDRDSRLESWELIVALKQLQADYRSNPAQWDDCIKDTPGSAKKTVGNSQDGVVASIQVPVPSATTTNASDSNNNVAKSAAPPSIPLPAVPSIQIASDASNQSATSSKISPSTNNANANSNSTNNPTPATAGTTTNGAAPRPVLQRSSDHVRTSSSSSNASTDSKLSGSSSTVTADSAPNSRNSSRSSIVAVEPAQSSTPAS